MGQERQNRYVSLSDQDYEGLLSLSHAFCKCQTHDDFKEVAHTKLFPFFNVHSMVYGWTDQDFNVQRLEGIGISQKALIAMSKGVANDPCTQFMFQTSRPVVAYDVDVAMEEFRKVAALYRKSIPEYEEIDGKIKTAICSMDFPDSTFGLGMHRWVEQPMTLREVRLLELIRPQLFLTIKTLFLNEELSKYKNVSDALADSTDPICLVDPHGMVGFCNSSFDALDVTRKGGKVPKEWMKKIDEARPELENMEDLEAAQVEIPFCQVNQQDYRMVVIPIQMEMTPERNYLLLRLKGAKDPYSQLKLKLQAAGLTAREMEICWLVKGGFSNEEAAARLFISPATITTHLKNIHRKLNVHNRTQLMTFLINTNEQGSGSFQ